MWGGGCIIRLHTIPIAPFHRSPLCLTHFSGARCTVLGSFCRSPCTRPIFQKPLLLHPFYRSPMRLTHFTRASCTCSILNAPIVLDPFFMSTLYLPYFTGALCTRLISRSYLYLTHFTGALVLDPLFRSPLFNLTWSHCTWSILQEPLVLHPILQEPPVPHFTCLLYLWTNFIGAIRWPLCTHFTATLFHKIPASTLNLKVHFTVDPCTVIDFGLLYNGL